MSLQNRPQPTPPRTHTHICTHARTRARAHTSATARALAPNHNILLDLQLCVITYTTILLMLRFHSQVTFHTGTCYKIWRQTQVIPTRVLSKYVFCCCCVVVDTTAFRPTTRELTYWNKFSSHLIQYILRFVALGYSGPNPTLEPRTPTLRAARVHRHTVSALCLMHGFYFSSTALRTQTEKPRRSRW